MDTDREELVSGPYEVEPMEQADMDHWRAVGVISLDCSLSEAETRRFDNDEKDWYSEDIPWEEGDDTETHEARELMRTNGWLNEHATNWSSLRDPGTVGSIVVGNEDDDLILGTENYIPFQNRRYELSKRQEKRMEKNQYFGDPKQVSSKCRSGPNEWWKTRIFFKAADRINDDDRRGCGQIEIGGRG